MHRPNLLTKAMDGLFKYTGNCAWLARALSYWGHLKTAHFGAGAVEKNSTPCVITAPAHTNYHAQIRFCTLWFANSRIMLCTAAE